MKSLIILLSLYSIVEGAKSIVSLSDRKIRDLSGKFFRTKYLDMMMPEIRRGLNKSQKKYLKRFVKEHYRYANGRSRADGENKPWHLDFGLDDDGFGFDDSKLSDALYSKHSFGTKYNDVGDQQKFDFGSEMDGSRLFGEEKLDEELKKMNIRIDGGIGRKKKRQRRHLQLFGHRKFKNQKINGKNAVFRRNFVEERHANDDDFGDDTNHLHELTHLQHHLHEREKEQLGHKHYLHHLLKDQKKSKLENDFYFTNRQRALVTDNDHEDSWNKNQFKLHSTLFDSSNDHDLLHEIEATQQSNNLLGNSNVQSSIRSKYSPYNFEKERTNRETVHTSKDILKDNQMNKLYNYFLDLNRFDKKRNLYRHNLYKRDEEHSSKIQPKEIIY
ncbi:hypothetical protein SNEBB_001133 [Seison nebaliae]|nr:hypothetical protein SNEBB_001133 [Seison nebaliae]